MFSNLEQTLYRLILSTNVPFPFYAQFQAGSGLEYQLDGAFPSLKLGVEADSKTYHSAPDKVASDRQRDMSLASQGWTVLRFTEEELTQRPQDVIQVIITVIRKITGAANNQAGSETI
jgi:very-short-patch-repair endonuclease